MVTLRGAFWRLRYNVSMGKLLGKFRIGILSVAAICLQAVKVSFDRWILGRAVDAANYTLLELGLYIGGYCLRPPPGTRAVLSLTPMRDAYGVEVYDWQPLQAGSAPTLAWLRERVEFIDAQRRAGLTVFVHCDAGIDRSGMVVVAYFMWRDGRSREEALEYVQRKRAIVRPNPTFMELLSAWGTALARADLPRGL